VQPDLRELQPLPKPPQPAPELEDLKEPGEGGGVKPKAPVENRRVASQSTAAAV
jgi:hypothetical protein